MDLVAFLKQKFRKIGSVLSGHTCNQRLSRLHRFLTFSDVKAAFFIHKPDLKDRSRVERICINTAAFRKVSTDWSKTHTARTKYLMKVFCRCSSWRELSLKLPPVRFRKCRNHKK